MRIPNNREARELRNTVLYNRWMAIPATLDNIEMNAIERMIRIFRLIDEEIQLEKAIKHNPDSPELKARLVAVHDEKAEL